MKKGFATMLMLVLMTFSFAQEDTTQVQNLVLRTNTISSSALYTMFGMLNVNYGKIINNGKNEYQIMAGTFGYEDSFNEDDTWDSSLDDGVMYGAKGASSFKATYRSYSKENAKGLFYQGELTIFSISWGHKTGEGDWNDVTSVSYDPTVALGYKYVPSFLFKDRLFIEAYAGASYSMFSPEDGEITLRDDEGEAQGGNEIQPQFNLFIGFDF